MAVTVRMVLCGVPGAVLTEDEVTEKPQPGGLRGGAALPCGVLICGAGGEDAAWVVVCDWCDTRSHVVSELVEEVRRMSKT
jgi:hypothetical protein